MTAAGIEPLAAECAQPAQEALSAAVDRVPASIPLTKVLSQEPIRDALTEQLQTGRHDLLVMGSRGRRALSASLLGSVSHYALNHSPIPVLVIHAEATEEHDAGDEAALTPAAAAPPTQT
jgi:nucleotide-binding universal stress UspA family protein